MDKNKINGYIGLSAVIIGVLTIIIMAELRTDGYTHYHKAISELGSWDAPNKWIFNIFGYMIPGMLLSIFAFNLPKEFRSYSIKLYPFYLLAISGLFTVVAGLFPADMNDRQSISTIVHSIGSLVGAVCWLLAVLTLWWQLKKSDEWKVLAYITLLIPFAMLIAMSFVSEDTPGLSQRIGFLANYVFILILAVKQLLIVRKPQ